MVGWSADGSLLLLEDEKNGRWSVMNRSGEISFNGSTGGCCLFVSSNWLSPDGASIIGGEPGKVDVVSLSTGDSRHLFDVAELEGVSGLRGGVWSPDGSQLAFAAEREGSMNVILVDTTTGVYREVVDSTVKYVRHVAWSPDGTQLLVTSAELTPDDRENPPNNPLLSAIPSRLYVVNVNGSGRREIASGHYVVAVWSPDGTRIAALDTIGRKVVLMNADGSGQTVLPDVTPSGPFTGIAWHPVP